FGTNETNGGSPVYAVNKAALYAGQPLGANDVQRKTAPLQTGEQLHLLTPADVDGSTSTPTNVSYFMRRNDDEINTTNPDPAHDFLEVWRMTADFANPNNTVLTRVANIQIPDYVTVGNITQPSPGPNLDPLVYPIMNRLTYRNFGTYEALVGSYTVDVAPGAAVRGGSQWFELRKVGAAGSWTLFQQGTVAPNDGVSRFMGSIAMDKNGNMALGYSVASATVSPGLRYIGRLSTDPLGTMPQGEFTLVNGGGFFNGGRWG